MQNHPALARLNRETLDLMLQPYGIHLLQASATATEVMVLASLAASENVSGAASKMKVRVSKWLRDRICLGATKRLLSRGYFACTTGDATTDEIERYLDKQAEHHGYTSRARPPVFVQAFALDSTDKQRLSAKHAVTLLRFHIVLSTWGRKGVFSSTAAQSITRRWLVCQTTNRWAIEKVSFVADHVHLALRVHPGTSPASAVVVLMNASQALMWSGFAECVVRAGVERLWTPSAYIGSFGDLRSVKIGAYVRQWAQQEML
jgi:REP element-mobilizing transposase RayT